MAEVSPYKGIPAGKWLKKTEELVAAHPLEPNELVEVVLTSWDGIFASEIGIRRLRVGRQIFPTPQILAFFLHELIPEELKARHPDQWRGQQAKDEKDAVCLSDARFSFEIKASSHAEKIFGNRSYAQKRKAGAVAVKEKAGYYLAINFEKCMPGAEPCIRVIRFGWLDHSDWIGQTAATGQQARLSDEVEKGKLLTLYRKK